MHIRTLIITALCCLSSPRARADLCTGPFAVGGETRSYIDASRGNRSISVLFRYPLAVGGQPLTISAARQTAQTWALMLAWLAPLRDLDRILVDGIEL